MRLINAEPILDKLFRLADRSTDIKNPYEKAKINAFRRAFEEVLHAPVVQFEYVRHGRWVKCECNPEDNEECILPIYECSCCRGRYVTKTKHCPHCGAKMDEVEV